MTDTQTQNAVFGVNPSLDREALRQEFQEKGRVRIPHFLHPDMAQLLLQCLTTDLSWGISYNDGPNARHIPRDQIDDIPDVERNQLMAQIIERARRQVQYAYAEAPLAQTYRPEQDDKHAAHRALEFFNSNVMMQLISDITMMEGGLISYAMASSFQPSHFFTLHNDRDPEGARRFGFFLDMTSVWRPDWGGVITFFDDEGQITESFNPLFNSFLLYDIKEHYSVSVVAPYANGARFSLNGWYRTPPTQN